MNPALAGALLRTPGVLSATSSPCSRNADKMRRESCCLSESLPPTGVMYCVHNVLLYTASAVYSVLRSSHLEIFRSAKTLPRTFRYWSDLYYAVLVCYVVQRTPSSRRLVVTNETKPTLLPEIWGDATPHGTRTQLIATENGYDTTIRITRVDNWTRKSTDDKFFFEESPTRQGALPLMYQPDEHHSQ